MPRFSGSTAKNRIDWGWKGMDNLCCLSSLWVEKSRLSGCIICLKKKKIQQALRK